MEKKIKKLASDLVSQFWTMEIQASCCWMGASFAKSAITMLVSRSTLPLMRIDRFARLFDRLAHRLEVISIDAAGKA
jgi:hypothetical protein